MQSQSAANAQRIIQLALIVAFLSGLAFTSYRSYLHVYDDVRDGMRSDVKRIRQFDFRKTRDWKHFPKDFEPVFQERVEGRDLAVRRFARFKLNWFNVSSTPRVVLGRDGWLFYHYEAEPTYFHPQHARVAEIRREWVKALPEWHQWLKARNIELLVVIAPNKQSIYPEFLPAIEQKRRVESPLDQLLGDLRLADPNLNVLDLRSALMEAKRSTQVYFRTDTHWNTDGMVAGYKEAVKHFGLQPLPDAAFHTGPGAEKTDGDLSRLLGYWDKGPELFTHWELKNPTSHSVPVEMIDDDPKRLTHLDTKARERTEGGRRAVLFHDSFGAGLFTELLAEHFGRILAVPSNHMDAVIIAREKPNVVILEIVERQFQSIGARLPNTDY